MKPPVDLDEPVQNPALVAAMDAFAQSGSDETLYALLDQLNRAVFLVPALVDEARIASQGGGSAMISGGSRIKVVHCEDSQGRIWLGLFTDWPHLHAWTNEPVNALVMPARDAWRFAGRRDAFVGAVINPARQSLPLDREKLAHLLALLDVDPT